MIDFWLGVFASLFATFLVWFFKIIINNLISKSDMTGIWKSEIYNSENEIIKRDTYNFKHNKRTNMVQGKIQREYPIEKDYRTWNSQGILRGDLLLLYFYSEKKIDSAGVAILRLQEDYKFVGYYFRIPNNQNKVVAAKGVLIKSNKENNKIY